MCVCVYLCFYLSIYIYIATYTTNKKCPQDPPKEREYDGSKRNKYFFLRLL